MAKMIDIKNGFRLIPVHPADRHLLMISWNNSVYIYLHVPFGLHSAPKLFVPLTVRTAKWRFGLMTNCGIDRIMSLNFHYVSYCPMRLS